MDHRLDSIARQYNVSWSSLLRVADDLWERQGAQLDRDRSVPERLVALFGLSFIREQLEAAWELAGLRRYRSARTTQRSALEALFQLCAVARPDSEEQRRDIAIRVLGQELTQKRQRLEQLQQRNDQGAAFDLETLEQLEAELERKSRRFVEQFGVEPSHIPISQLAEMGGIGGHYFAYLEDKIFPDAEGEGAGDEQSEEAARRVIQDCCGILLSALRAACRLLGEDYSEVLDSNERRMAKLGG